MTTNNVNGKRYFGCHFWKGNGLDPKYFGSGVALKNALRKYGKENFTCEIVKEFSCEEDARLYEEEILRMFDLEHDDLFYNMKSTSTGFGFGELHIPCSGSDNPMFGKSMPEETKRKISETMKKKGIRPPDPKKVSVICITTNEIFESASSAARHYNLDRSSIIKCCKGKLKTVGGKTWKYID